jgi:hypothetical protein
MVFMSDVALTAMTLGVVKTMARGTKSLAGSKGMSLYKYWLMVWDPMVPMPMV